MIFKAHARNYNLVIIFCALLLIFCVASFSLLINMGLSEYIAFAAGNKASENASLDNGYLKPGTNILSTQAAQEDPTGGYWPSSGYEASGYNARDFFAPSGTNVLFGPDHLEFYGGNVGVKTLLNADSLDVSSALSKAMQDQNFIINFTFEAQVQIGGQSGSNVTLDTTIEWFPSGTGGSRYAIFTGASIVQPVGGSFPLKVALGGDNVDNPSGMPDPLNALYTNVPIQNNLACFLVKISDTSNVSSVPVIISSPKIYMDVEISGLSINVEDYGILIQGDNRQQTNIPGIKDPETSGPNMLEETFVKKGDILSLRAQVMNSGLRYEFPDFYTALFFPVDDDEFIGRTCLDWHTYSSTFDESMASYLKPVSLPIGATPEEIEQRYFGYNVQFEVKDGVGNTNQVKLLPRLPIQIVSGTVNYYDFDIASIPDKEIVVKVDDKAPSSAIIDTIKGIGITIESREWYTISRSIYLDYSSDLVTDFEKNAYEKVYAYVLHDSVGDFDVSQCDFSKPASDPSNGYPFGQGDTVANMQDLGKYSNLMLGGGKLPLSIATPGEYTLVLISVDSAGNISSPSIYHKGNRKSIKVDDTTKEVGFILKYGLTEYTVNYSSNVGDVYIYIGNNWHTKKLDGTYAFTALDNNLSGDGVYQRRTNPAKRNQPVTLRFLMKPVHFNTFNPVRYSNQPAMEGMWSDNPTYRTGRDGRYYEITFTMNDEIWNSGQDSGVITMYFNKKVDLGLISSDFTFTKNQNTELGEIIGLEGYFEAFFPYNPQTETKTYPPIQPDLNIQYYVLEEYQAYIKTKIEGNQTVTTTGGYVVYKGNQYDLPDEYDLVSATRVANTISLSTIAGIVNLTTITRVDGPLVAGFKSFYISGYIKESSYQTGFIDAGRYVYKVNVNLTGDTNLFGEKIDIYEVKKAEPKVFGLHGENTLYYGDSMDDLTFSSTYENGNPIVKPGFVYGDKFYSMSSAGVFGYYQITSPSPGTPQYNVPEVMSNLRITINFYPVDVVAGVDNSIISANWSNVFYNYYDRVMTESGYVYSLIPGKSHSGNYKLQTLQISIEIRPTQVYLGVNPATTRTTFNQQPQQLEVMVYLDVDKTQILTNIYTLVLYRNKLVENSVFSTTKPTNAGLYQAKIDIDTSRSNYFNEVSLLQDFTIEKMELDIYPVPPEGDEDIIGYSYEFLNESQLFGQYEAVSKFTFRYGYLDVPEYLFGIFENSLFVETTGLLVKHSFQKVKDENGNYLDPYDDWVNQNTPGILISDLLSAGTHLTEISIDNPNYEGQLIVLFVIEQGTAENNRLSVNMPLLKRSYDAVGLDGALQGKLGQLEFGQTLSDMTSTILSGVDTRGMYVYRNKNSYVPGIFYFEGELEYYARVGGAIEPEYNALGHRILDVKYGVGASLNRIMPHTVTLYWEAGEYVNQSDGLGGFVSVFVSNNNFSILSFPADIYVVRAIPNTSNLRLSNIVYKQKLLDATFTGEVVSNGISLVREVDYIMRLSINPQTIYPGGNHNVLCVFEPTQSNLKHYMRVENIPIPLIVEKREIDLSFPSNVERDISVDELNGTFVNPHGIAYTYGTMYQNPTTIIKNHDNEIIVTDAQLEYIYFKDKPMGYILLTGETIMPGYEDFVRMPGTGINNSTNVGKYYMLARTVGNNYIGSVWKEFYVVKADLYIDTPNKPSIEYMSNLGSVVFPLINAQNADSTKIISGRFSYIEVDAFPEVGSTNPYLITFIPTTAQALYLNFKPLSFALGVNVLKKTLDITVTNLNHVYTGTQKQILGQVFNPDNPESNLLLSYVYLTIDGQLPKNAGEYQVNVSISPSVERYRGTKLVTMKISKSPVNIVSTDVTKEYTGMPQALIPLYSISEGTLSREFAINELDGFKVTYYNRQNAPLLTAPQSVGLYYVSVELITQNYSGQANLSYWISPSLKTINNLHQTYCPPSNDVLAPKVKPVNLSFNEVTVTRKDIFGIDQTFVEPHQNVAYTVYYKKKYVANQQFQTDLDISSAGLYDVRIDYSENGYNKVIYGSELIVEKEILPLGLEDYYFTFYTSSNLRLEGITLPGDVQEAQFYYRSYRPNDPIQDDFSLTVFPKESGIYQVKIVLVDENYQGEETTLFEIKKASLTIIEVPRVNAIQFNTSKENVSFIPGTGLARFSVTGQNVTELGVWTIQTDTHLLIVGVGYPVVVRFTPDETIISNFNIVETEMNISVTKRDIGMYIVFDPYSLICSYSGSELTASAWLLEAANIVQSYGRIQLEYYYDGIVRNPKDVRVYDLVVRINDKNYFGVSETKYFEIKKAIPIIVPPSLLPISLNHDLKDSDIILQTGNGINPNDDQIIVLGSFSFYETSQIMNKANYRPVLMNFHPNDSDSYMDVNFEIQVYVIGSVVNVTNVEAIPSVANPLPKYGTPLSEFSLNIWIDGVPATTQDGSWYWLNPLQVLSIGASAAYEFVPTNTDIYNIYKGNVEVPFIQEAEMNVLVEDWEIRIFVGSGIDPLNPDNTLMIDLAVSNKDYPEIKVSPKVEILSSDNVDIVFAEILATSSYAGGLLKYNNNDLYITFRLKSPNYNEATVRLPIKVFNKVLSKDIIVTNKVKKYDGKTVQIVDFGIVISGTSRPILDSSLLITGIKHNGKTVDSIKIPGDYLISVNINDTHYYGNFEFSYFINKNDITSHLNAVNNERVYSDNTPLASASFGDYNQVLIATDSLILYKYIDKDGVTELGPLPPRDAGDYWLEISIDSTDIYFSAKKRFSYIIHKKEAFVELNNSYTYSYGSVIAVIPTLSNSLSQKDYIINYFVSGESTPLISKPSNIGRYRVSYTISHRNYYGYSETVLVINKLRLELNVAPTVNSLEYGVKLETAGFTGGEVVTNDSAATRVYGVFVFVEPNATPQKGLQNVQVRFNPNNDNYEPITFVLEISITKRNANVNFVSSNTVYNGMSQLPVVRTDPELGIRVKFTIYRNGLQVNNAIDVGSYRIVATISDENYEGLSILEVFQIIKAKVIVAQSVMPTATPIEYNQALNKSSLIDGLMLYVENGKTVAGSFMYSNPDIMLGPVGIYDNIPYKFFPVDINNYEIFEATLSVSVLKTNATISALNTVFVYGSQIKRPLFATNPANLNVENLEFEENIDSIIQVGTYRYTAFISDTNYKGSIVYNITVIKKSVEIQFYLGTVPVDAYRTTYGNIVYAKAKLKTTTLVPRDIQYVDDLEKNLQYIYSLNNSSNNQYTSVTPSVNIGEYRVYARMDHRNYELQENVSWVTYQISRADIQRLEFDYSSLSTQIYGSVTIPTVLITPSNVGVKLSFPGYADMPTNAGTHSVRVEVIDRNYNPSYRNGTFIILPKEISIENIQAYDKAVDGLSDIKVVGTLGGVLQGDEVFLDMTAYTENHATAVGTHNVIINSWRLNGLHASNYSLRPPIYLLHMKITNKVVKDISTNSYITSSSGFNSNVTVSFKDVYDTINRTSFLTSLIGQKATVQTISVKENGLNTVLDEKVKFYIKIPDAYINSENLVVEGLGNLGAQSITFTREGDYMTFYADTSGEIIFYNNDFPNWIIILASSIAVVIIGVVLLVVLMPKKKRKVVTVGARQAYDWTQEAKELEVKSEVLARLKEKDKKRKWRL